MKGFSRDPKELGDINIHLKLEPEVEELAVRFSRGQKVKVVARVTGYLLLGGPGWINLEKGELTEIDKSTLVELTAEAFAAEFENNPGRAFEKYKTIEVIVTGTVDMITDRPGDNKEVRLKGTGKTNVRTNLTGKSAAKAIQGQPLSLRPDFSQFRPQYSNNSVYITYVVIVAKKQ